MAASCAPPNIAGLHSPRYPRRSGNSNRGLGGGGGLLVTMGQRSEKPFGGSLRLAAISTLGPYLFPRILAQLRHDYPKLGLILGEGLTGELLPKLIDGEIDAVLLSLPQTDPALATAQSFQSRSCWRAPRATPPVRKVDQHGTGSMPMSGCCWRRDISSGSRP